MHAASGDVVERAGTVDALEAASEIADELPTARPTQRLGIDLQMNRWALPFFALYSDEHPVDSLGFTGRKLKNMKGGIDRREKRHAWSGGTGCFKACHTSITLRARYLAQEPRR